MLKMKTAVKPPALQLVPLLRLALLLSLSTSCFLRPCALAASSNAPPTKTVSSKAKDAETKRAETKHEVDLLVERANDEIANGHLDAGIELALQGLKLDITSAQAAWSAGYGYQLKNDTKRAIEYYTMAALLDPTMSQAYCNRALCYEDFNHHDYALEDFSKAIELDPKNDYAFASRAEVNYVLGKYDDCIADARKAIELNKDNAFAYAQLGAALSAQGKYSEAVDAHKSVVSRDKSRPVYFKNLALAQIQLKQYDNALESLTDSLAVKPTGDTYRLRAEVYARKGEFKKALADYSAAIRLNRDDSYALSGRAVINYLLGDSQAAVDDARAAAKMLVTDPDAYVALVVEDNAKGLNQETRINYLRRALQTYDGKYDGRLFLLSGCEELRANRKDLAQANFDLAKNFGFTATGAAGNGGKTK